MSYHYTLIRMDSILKIEQTSNAGKDAEKLDHWHIADKNVKPYNHSGKLACHFLIKLNMHLTGKPAISHWSIYLIKVKIHSHWKISTERFKIAFDS